jgi:DNA-binding GntR family transcriptional regulator
MKSPKLASDNAAFPVARLERETLHDRAYLELKKAIMSGAIRPGATITIRAMAAALGTSPMPVREALRRLVSERALVMLPTRSVTLPLMTAAQFDEICRIRVALEGMVTETAAGLITQEELRRMQQVHAEMSRLKTQHTSTYLAKNQQLHFTLYQAARMPVALQVIESLWLQAGPLLNLALSEIGLRTGQDHHRELLEALSKRDAKAARAALEADLTDAAHVIREFLDSRPDTATG